MILIVGGDVDDSNVESCRTSNLMSFTRLVNYLNSDKLLIERTTKFVPWAPLEKTT